MILPLTTESKAAAVSIGEIAATTRSSGTFSVDETTPLYVQARPFAAATIQRTGTPLTASPEAQANTPPPLPANGTPAPLAPVIVSSSAQTPEDISPVTLLIGIAVLWIIFWIL